MNFERFLNYKTEDFILDDDFLRWVSHPDETSTLFWTGFIEKNPDKKDLINEAIILIKALKWCADSSF